MLEKTIYNIVEDLGRHNNYNEEQIEQMKYTAKVLTYEIIKVILIITIFSFLGYFKEVILIIGVMGITKPFIGGYHEDTQVKCFMATFIISVFILFIANNSNLSLLGSITLSLISIFCIYNQAPIIDSKMPLTKKKLIKRNRLIGITSASILSVVAIIMYNITWLSQILIWTIVVQAMLMFNKYQKDRRS